MLHRTTSWTYRRLQAEVQRIAGALRAIGCSPSSRIAIIMPLTPIAIATYLAVIYVGAATVSIAESFSSAEMQARMSIAGVTLTICQVRAHAGSARPRSLWRCAPTHSIRW